MHVSSLGVIISTVEICLAQFDCNNKITNKALPGLGEFCQVIEPFQHEHNTRKPHHYLQITKQLQIMGNLSIIASILMHFLNQGTRYLDKTFLARSSIEI
jgi:hypothetical protein